MSIHDLIFFVGNIALCLALVPALLNRITAPLWTTLLTSATLATFAVNYATMNFVLSAIACGISASLWVVVLARSRRQPKTLKPNWYNDWHSPTKRFPGWNQGDES